MSAPMAPITNKVMRPTRRRGGERMECWEATTLDGRYVIERIEEPGTPWAVWHVDSRLQVSLYASLAKARRAIAAGHVDRALAAKLEERAWA